MANIEKINEFRNILRQFEQATTNQVTECCSGVTQAQCTTLLEIEKSEPTTISELTKVLGLDKSTLSRTIESLVRKKLITRRTDPKNRRSSILKLTNKGEQTCKESNDQSNQFYQKVFKNIPKSKHKDIVDMFEVFVSAMDLEKEITNEEGCC